MKFFTLIGTLILVTLIVGCAQGAQRNSMRRCSLIRPLNFTQHVGGQEIAASPSPYITAHPQSPYSESAGMPFASIPMPIPMPATSTSIITKKDVGVMLPPINKRKPKDKGLIIIDPGHGGDDYGTHSHGKPTYHEKYLNLTTAEMLKKFLQQYGYKVVLTRNDDTFISLENRAIFANEKKAKLFVSVHYNSAPNRDASGIEVFYYRNDKDKSRASQSKILAHCVLDKILKNTNGKSRGVKHGNFSVIRETRMPAILIEGGFLTNADEMKKLNNPAYLKAIAFGIAQGLADYTCKESVLAEK